MSKTFDAQSQQATIALTETINLNEKSTENLLKEEETKEFFDNYDTNTELTHLTY